METESERKSFITITHGMRGWFAVHMWWNPDLDGFWEPYQSGIGSHKDRENAITEGKGWAKDEEMEFRETMP